MEMPRALYVLPIVFFTAMCGFFVSYDTATAPANLPARIQVEAVGEGTPAPAPVEPPTLGAYPQLEGVRINLNTADPAALEQLPGIGPKKAADIAAYVRENGPLSSVEQLLEVKGIGEKTLENLRPYITVDETSTAS